MIGTDFTLLYLTLVFAFISFLCSTYTTLRTLLPLLPGHPLNRRQNSTQVGPYAPAPALPAEKHPRLKSAQRFTAYLAAVDIFAASILVWEAACAASGGTQLGNTQAAASRIYLASTARPTLLLVVAVLSYANVVQGRQIALGKVDWIVWAPALVIYAAGAGLASIPQPNGPNVWIGLIAWLSACTVVVTGCFGRLLVAILRVRRLSRREQSFSRSASEQDQVISQGDLPYPTLPAWQHKFSVLSSSFVGQIGRSTSSIDLPSAHYVVPFTSDTRSAVSYAPSCTSTEYELDRYREFRSPTPGSSHLLLDRSSTSTPSGLRSPVPPLPFDEPPEVLGDEKGDCKTAGDVRLSLSSFTSRASTYLAPGGFIGNSTVRNALSNSLVKQAWAGQDPPGTGHNPRVELSQKESKGAMIRLGGHLVSSLFGYAFISPFVYFRLIRPADTTPLALALLLAIGVCHPGVILAYQCGESEGFWFKTAKPPVLTSSSAVAFEQFEGVQIEGNRSLAAEEVPDRSQSRASTVHGWKDEMPGIKPDGADCSTQRSRVGRALSMMSAHPKLQVLPYAAEVEPSSKVSGFVKSATKKSHARLRSLKLSSTSVTSVDNISTRTRTRAGSAASRKTVGGHEHHHRNASAPVRATDTLIAMSLLQSRKPEALPPTQDKLPFGFGETSNRSSLLHLPSEKRSPFPSPVPSPSLYPTSTPTADLAFLHSEFAFSPTATTYPSSSGLATPTPPNPIPDLTIDYLSAQVLPKLVPSIKLGKDVKIGAEDAPLPRRRSTISSTEPAGSFSSRLAAQTSSFGSKRSRNIRNLSLPLFSLQPAEPAESSPVSPQLDMWVTVEMEMQVKDGADEPKAILTNLKQVVRDSAVEAEREASRARSAIADSNIYEWDAVEAPSGVVEPAAVVEPLVWKRPSQVDGERRGSVGTKLDISFEWEQEGASEVLDGALADAEDAEDDDEEAGAAVLEAHYQARLAASPLSPLTPSSSSFFPRQPSPQPRRPVASQDGSIVLRGSQVLSSSDEEDTRTGTIHCASIHPVSRHSDSSSVDLSSFNLSSLRPAHLPAPSISSARSLGDPTSPSGLTAPGFRNMLETRTWHQRSDESSAGEDQIRPDSRASSAGGGRRPLPGLPVQPGHRPLSLLGQRDVNTSFSTLSVYSCASDGGSGASDVEAQKVQRHRTATAERDATTKQQKRQSRSGMPLPPLPDVPAAIEEVDEDAKSRKSGGTPTPKLKRVKGQPSPATRTLMRPPLPLPPLPLASNTAPPSAPSTSLAQPATKTPPHVTSRSRARRHHGRDSSASSSANDENVQPLFSGSKPPRRTGADSSASSRPSAVRVMR
ncbi:hypothetical protein JCM11251_004250 [Rhodosporidiobolus azoricus]